MRFVLVAGEASGDRLGAALISALKARFPEAEFVGVGGAEMEAAGLDAWFGLDAFSVNGFVEPLLKLPSLLSCLLYTSPSPRDKRQSRMPSSA